MKAKKLAISSNEMSLLLMHVRQEAYQGQAAPVLLAYCPCIANASMKIETNYAS